MASTSNLKQKDWSASVPRRFNATEVVASLAKIEGWTLDGDGEQIAIAKTFSFANYFETMAFVNGVALVAHRLDHHPDLAVHYSRCTVRWNTHSVGGLSAADFECAAQVDALLAPI